MQRLRDTEICKLLGCRVPIVLAGMGGAARSELAAAVSDAGGFGFLGMVREPTDLIRREVERVRAAGHTHFGVNLIPAATDPGLLDEQVSTCIALNVPVVGLFWELDASVVARLRDAGILVVYQVGSVDEAIAVERAGAQVIIAQGREAGGHVRGTQRLADLLPKVVRSVRVPVLAAGGLASGGDLVTALALGAKGIVLGTALLATDESFAHDYHKRRLVDADGGDTTLTRDFHVNWPPGAAVRVLRGPVTDGGRGDPHSPQRIVIGEEEGRPIYLFSTDSPLRSMSGTFADMALYAGTGVGAIRSVEGATARIGALMREAEDLLAVAPQDMHTELSSPVCYVGEFSGSYVGLLDDGELAIELDGLASELKSLLRASLVAGAERVDAPPFPEAAKVFAAWTLVVADLASTLNGGPIAPQEEAPAASTQELRTAILRHLGSLVPAVPEGATRDALVRLREQLQEEQMASLSPNPIRGGIPQGK